MIDDVVGVVLYVYVVDGGVVDVVGVGVEVVDDDVFCVVEIYGVFVKGDVFVGGGLVGEGDVG